MSDAKQLISVLGKEPVMPRRVRLQRLPCERSHARPLVAPPSRGWIELGVDAMVVMRSRTLRTNRRHR